MISITAMCRSSARRWSRSITLACVVTSSAVVGSSAISSSGFDASAIAIITRCRMPPENSCGYCVEPRPRRLHADLGEQLDGALDGFGLARVGVEADRLDQLVADRLDRVERAERVLEDHRDPPAAHAAEDVLLRAAQLELAERDRAAADLPRRLEQPEDRHRDGRLAGSRLADHAEPLARPDRQRQTVDRQHRPVLEWEVDDEVGDREHDILRLPAGRPRAIVRRAHGHDAALPVALPAVIGVVPGVSTATSAPALPLRCTATSMPSLTSMYPSATITMQRPGQIP